MLETLRAILESASFFGLFRLLSTCSTTDVVFIFLCSKPLFVLAAIGIGLRGHLADGGSLGLPDYYDQPDRLPGPFPPADGDHDQTTHEGR